MSDKDTNSSEMPKKKSRQSLKVTIKKNKFWIKIFTGGFVFVVVILCSWTGYNAFTIFQAQGGDTVDNVFKAINSSYKIWPYCKPTVEGSLLGFALYGMVIIGVIYHDASKKNTKEGREYGSSRKGDVFEEASKNDALENKVEAKRDEDANIILSKNVKVDMDTWHTGINDNIFVVGGSGTGKTRYFVKPNILQMYCNYVVIDPKGSVAEECGMAFEKNGYNVGYLNLVKMDKSMGYNPFEYFRKPEDVQSFVQNLISNTSDKNKSGGDEFFVKAEMTWLMSMIYLIMSECRGDENLFSFNTVLMLLQHSDAKEDGNDTYESDVDRLFKQLQREHRAETHGAITYTYRDLAILNYQIYKLGAGKTAKSILISIGVRLSIFASPELKRILQKDELHLERLGQPMITSAKENECKNLSLDIDRDVYERFTKGRTDKPSYEDLPKNRLRKSILFIVINDSDDVFNFMASIILQQLYTQLYYIADARADHKLPIHVRIINDEFANCGKQPDFNRKISTMRSREISTAVIVQGISQIKSKSLYGDDWEAIFENCSITLFLGSKGPTTQKVISELAGKETVTHVTHSTSKGTSSSYTVGEQLIASDVYSIGDIAMLDNRKCLIHIQGQHIYEDWKYDVKDHPRVDETCDAHDKEVAKQNFFDIDVFLEKVRQLEKLREETRNKYIKENQTESESKMDGYRRGEYSGKTDLLISNDAVYQTQNDLEFVEETIQDEERYDVDGFLPKSDISNF
ncbi:VirD4-like conjugal transfer protein, CD1115 family [Holdemanella biformis]|uniref:VirD4-like conjugal transfer protein, CD1115 family n=1 Tax=Holdemanella biformis TaxID=1735 RepID=UPI001899045B|nr:type IV secretory system conjugative DNA transfer family protein [Holdemanella biformis]